MTYPAVEMHETLVVSPRLGETGYGATFGALYNLRCYLEPGFRRVTDTNGQEVTCSLFCVAPRDSTLAVGDMAEWQGRRYEAVEVQPIRDAGRTNHVEAYFKSAGDTA